MTYQLLLVDDEVHAIEGVKADLDLEQLRISQLFTAFNVKQAKEIMEREQIDILLCDIEMPQGSGLELLAWVNEHYPDTETIFLTSHADFKYAKEAVRLGSLDYLLKPVLAEELEEAIGKAQAVIDRNNEVNRNQRSHLLWMKHHALVVERFWLDLINHTIPSTSSAIREQAELQQLPIADSYAFLPILIAVQRWNKALNRRDEQIMEFAPRNTAEELILGSHSDGNFFYLDRGLLVGILASGQAANLETAIEACGPYIHTCNRYFYCDLTCYVGHPVGAVEVAGLVAELREQHRNNVAFTNRVFRMGETVQESRHIELPELNVWLSLLKTGTKEAVVREVEKFMERLVQTETIGATVLHQFQQDFMQAVYSYLNMRGVQAHRLFGDEQSKRFADAAGRSVKDTLSWVHDVIDKAIHQAEAVDQTNTVVETVKQYIAAHIDQDLSRETLAELVFLNPDHLTRIFKAETGYPISDYVLAERIRLACELLAQTDIPVSAIASSVGSTNFSHFARIFKKYVGLGPTEYRSKSKNDRMS